MGRRVINKDVQNSIINDLRSGKKYEVIAELYKISISYIHKLKEFNNIKIRKDINKEKREKVKNSK
jgi:hypothetical protein